MSAKPQIALVAGAAGFIGSHLCETLLARGMKVVGVDNYSTGRPENIAHLSAGNAAFAFLQRDVIEPLPRSVRADIVFNFACPASPRHYQADPICTMLTNVVGTNNLLEMASRCDARFVQSSTSEVYGDPDVHPQHEEYHGNVNLTGPRACYDEGKRAAETLCFDYVRSRSVDVRVTRIFNTYGPRMLPDDGRVVSNFIAQAMRGDPITIYGDGKQTRSFCYVDDLVDGIIRLATHPRRISGPVNLGNPAEITVSELAAKVVALTGSKSRVEAMPLPVDDPRRRKPDITIARELLGWSPSVPLIVGLSRTIGWHADESSKPSKRRKSKGRAEMRTG